MFGASRLLAFVGVVVCGLGVGGCGNAAHLAEAQRIRDQEHKEAIAEIKSSKGQFATFIAEAEQKARSQLKSEDHLKVVELLFRRDGSPRASSGALVSEIKDTLSDLVQSKCAENRRDPLRWSADQEAAFRKTFGRPPPFAMEDGQLKVPPAFKGYFAESEARRKMMSPMCELRSINILGMRERISVNSSGEVTVSADAVADIFRAALKREEQSGNQLIRAAYNVEERTRLNDQIVEAKVTVGRTHRDGVAKAAIDHVAALHGASTALLFILRHEAAHLELRHHGKADGSRESCEVRRQAELEADTVAARALGATSGSASVAKSLSIFGGENNFYMTSNSRGELVRASASPEMKELLDAMKETTQESVPGYSSDFSYLDQALIAGVEIALDPSLKLHTRVLGGDGCRYPDVALRRSRALASLKAGMAGN